MATTTLVSVTPRNRQPGTFTFNLPDPVPVGVRYATCEMLVDLSDKLAVGKSLTVEFHVSPDGTAWTFANGTTWQSYGPSGLTVTHPDGTQTTNPNPMITIGLTGWVGQFVRGILVLPQALQVGTVVTVTN